MSLERRTNRREALKYLGAAGASFLIYRYLGGLKDTHAQVPQNHDNIKFQIKCIDPPLDEHPKSADILGVRVGENSSHKFFEFTLNGNVRTRNSHLGPDEGYGVAYLNREGKVEALALAEGAERTADTQVAVVKLKEPQELRGNPATPFKVETVFEDEGAESIEVSPDGKVVVFRVPKTVISPWLEKKEVYLTTEAVGHGSRLTPKNHNKDLCLPEEVLSTPTSTATSTPSPRATSTPQPSETSTPVPKPPKELPPTGNAPKNASESKKAFIASGAALSTAATITLAGEFIRRKIISRKNP